MGLPFIRECRTQPDDEFDALLDRAEAAEAERERLRGLVNDLRQWDMLAEGSPIADAPYWRMRIDAALAGDEA